ncbi:MAG: NAD(P)/FAD-dependent oxidoreductase, partial [Eubacteriales bacterium]|nr:NAD(P)/FAD-dependent oxidoreductase [Eubacteriales bacterium]
LLSELPENMLAADTIRIQIDTVVRIMKSLRLPVSRTRGFQDAMATAGGVSLREIDPRTMACRRQPRLFFAGEVLDIDGDTGGYNLQAAFSTGWLAGREAARLIRTRPV